MRSHDGPLCKLRTRVLAGAALLALGVLCLSTVLLGSVSDECGTTGAGGATTGGATAEPFDTLRCLVVFAAFTDGTETEACDPSGWPFPEVGGVDSLKVPA